MSFEQNTPQPKRASRHIRSNTNIDETDYKTSPNKKGGKKNNLMAGDDVSETGSIISNPGQNKQTFGARASQSGVRKSIAGVGAPGNQRLGRPRASACFSITGAAFAGLKQT